LLTEPWLTLAGICFIYLLLIPVGIVAYAKVKRQRAARQGDDVHAA
jgi:CDP-diacylglycerol--serine O-phosphatidyltransferase